MDFFSDAWLREIFKLFVAVFIFGIGFLSSSLRDIYRGKRKRQSERLFFETRLVKLIKELLVFIEGFGERRIDDTNIYVPKFNFINTYTFKELKLVDQVSLYHDFIGRAKKDKRKLIARDFDLLMISLDNINRLYTEIPKNNKEFLDDINKIREEWIRPIDVIDGIYSELPAMAATTNIKEISVRKKFAELRAIAYEEQIKKEKDRQFTMDSVYNQLIMPLRLLMQEYNTTQLAQQILPSIIELERIYRDYVHKKSVAKANDARWEHELRSLMRSLSTFVETYSKRSLKQFGL